MAFEPRSGEHALVEAVFGIALSQPVSPDQFFAIANNHALWKEDLPRVERLASMPFFLGNTVITPQNNVQMMGIVFDEVKRDASLSWRMKIENNMIYINCLSYDAWANVWAKAKDLIIRLQQAVFLGNGTSVVSCVLQVIDAFDWSGSAEEYDAKQLFRSNEVHIMSSVLEKGPYWHHYQGWYRYEGLPEGVQKTLERVSIDAAIEPTSGTCQVKFDAYQQLDLNEPVEFGAFLGADGSCDQLFNFLHDSNKRLLSEYISDEMARKIKLYGTVA